MNQMTLAPVEEQQDSEYLDLFCECVEVARDAANDGDYSGALNANRAAFKRAFLIQNGDLRWTCYHFIWAADRWVEKQRRATQ